MKNILERSTAALSLVATSLLILLCMILICLESRGWALYHQWRIGKGGMPFLMCKLRTMTMDGKKLTHVGRFLKFLHLDELPQLVNIIKGEMSFSGPRALIKKEVSENGYYAPRDSNVLPGLTGLLQTSFFDRRNATAREVLDRVYCIRKSVLLDLKIVFYRTPRFILLRICGVPFY